VACLGKLGNDILQRYARKLHSHSLTGNAFQQLLLLCIAQDISHCRKNLPQCLYVILLPYVRILKHGLLLPSFSVEHLQRQPLTSVASKPANIDQYGVVLLANDNIFGFEIYMWNIPLV